jgi:hypothetical protein
MDWHVVLSNVLQVLLIAAIPVLGTLCIQLFGAIKKWLLAHTSNTILTMIINEGAVVATSLEQTLMPELEAKVKAGTLTPAAALVLIKTEAMSLMKARLGKYESMIPDFEKRISDSIESAVLQIGIQQAAAVAQTPKVAQPAGELGPITGDSPAL